MRLVVENEQARPGTLLFAGTNASGNAIWVGDLYVTNGPWFGAPVFSSSHVTYRKVGEITYVAQYTESGLLSYSVDGILVNKEIAQYKSVRRSPRSWLLPQRRKASR